MVTLYIIAIENSEQSQSSDKDVDSKLYCSPLLSLNKITNDKPTIVTDIQSTVRFMFKILNMRKDEGVLLSDRRPTDDVTVNMRTLEGQLVNSSVH